MISSIQKSSPSSCSAVSSICTNQLPLLLFPAKVSRLSRGNENPVNGRFRSLMDCEAKEEKYASSPLQLFDPSPQISCPSRALSQPLRSANKTLLPSGCVIAIFRSPGQVWFILTPTITSRIVFVLVTAIS